MRNHGAEVTDAVLGDAKESRAELADLARFDVKAASEWRAARPAADASVSMWKTSSRTLLGRARQLPLHATGTR